MNSAPFILDPFKSLAANVIDFTSLVFKAGARPNGCSKNNHHYNGLNVLSQIACSGKGRWYVLIPRTPWEDFASVAEAEIRSQPALQNEGLTYVGRMRFEECGCTLLEFAWTR